ADEVIVQTCCTACQQLLHNFCKRFSLRPMNYTVKAAARATGVSESRLRTWERRYGIPRPERGPSGRRLYDEDDLAIIRRMAALVDSVVSALDASQAARSSSQPPPPVEQEEEDPLVDTLATAAERF